MDSYIETLNGKNILVTGSSGHLGEALIRTFHSFDMIENVKGIDILPSSYTNYVGSITDSTFVNECMKDIQIVFHTATLHKPHVATHTRQAFVDTNITGTLTLLEAAIQQKIEAFIFTSSTSVFGDALVPPNGSAAAWITEEVVPIPKNIYGITKTTAEDLCQLYYRLYKLPTIVLRTSRFFPEEDDNRELADSFSNENIKVLEFLNRRIDIEDVVSAHIHAAIKAKEIGFSKYIISATAPFQPKDLITLRLNAPEVIAQYYPQYINIFATFDWKCLTSFDRVYVNTKARNELGWNPKHSFETLLHKFEEEQVVTALWSPLAKEIGWKRYHRK